MSTDIILDEGKYISSKRASEMTGYAQDYIGQLSRGGLIDARRIGGLWYVSMDSLLAYKNKSEEVKPRVSIEHANTFPDADSFTHSDGKEYISANRASKVTGYNQDYVGQLARGGKIVSRQIGNRWYVEKDALLAHKQEKDALLAAVQVESVGIMDTTPTVVRSSRIDLGEPVLTYTNDEGDLLPVPMKGSNEAFDAGYTDEDDNHAVPIRVVQSRPRIEHVADREVVRQKKHEYAQKGDVRQHGMTIKKAIYPVIALTVVVVLSVGMVGLGKVRSYASSGVSSGAFSSVSARLASTSLVANAAVGFEVFIAAVERMVTEELIYQRSQ